MYVYFQKLSRALNFFFLIHKLSRISRTCGNPVISTRVHSSWLLYFPIMNFISHKPLTELIMWICSAECHYLVNACLYKPCVLTHFVKSRWSDCISEHWYFGFLFFGFLYFGFELLPVCLFLGLCMLVQIPHYKVKTLVFYSLCYKPQYPVNGNLTAKQLLCKWMYACFTKHNPVPSRPKSVSHFLNLLNGS